MNAPRWSPARGSIPPTAPGCSRTGRPRSLSSASAGRRVATWWWSRTRRSSTTSSCARCARVTRAGTRPAAQLVTRALRIGPAWSASHGSCWPKWVALSLTTSRSGCGTRRPRCAISCCRCAREHRSMVGGRTRRPRHPRRHDRRRPAVSATKVVDAGFAEPSLPRSNGALFVRCTLAGTRDGHDGSRRRNTPAANGKTSGAS